MIRENIDPFKRSTPFIRRPNITPAPKPKDPVRRILPVNPIAPSVPKPKLPRPR